MIHFAFSLHQVLRQMVGTTVIFVFLFLLKRKTKLKKGILDYPLFLTLDFFISLIIWVYKLSMYIIIYMYVWDSGIREHMCVMFESINVDLLKFMYATSLEKVFALVSLFICMIFSSM